MNAVAVKSIDEPNGAYDEIRYKGFGGAPRTMRVNYAQLQDPGVLRSGFSIQTYRQLFPSLTSSFTTNFNPKVVRSVTLANNQQYQFQYNSHGELARVVLPTGGAFEYDYEPGEGIVAGHDSNPLNIYRRAITKRVYENGSLMESKTTFGIPASAGGNNSYVLIDQYKADGITRLSQQKIYYEGFATDSFLHAPTEYSPWKHGREYQSEAIDANGSLVLRRTVQTWQQPIAGSSWPLTQGETNAETNAAVNPTIPRLLKF